MLEKFKTWVIKAVEMMISLLIVIFAITIVDIAVKSVIAIFTGVFGFVLGTILGVSFWFSVIYLIWKSKPISVDIKVSELQDEEPKVGMEIVTEPA